MKFFVPFYRLISHRPERLKFILLVERVRRSRKHHSLERAENVPFASRQDVCHRARMNEGPGLMRIARSTYYEHSPPVGWLRAAPSVRSRAAWPDGRLKYATLRTGNHRLTLLPPRRHTVTAPDEHAPPALIPAGCSRVWPAPSLTMDIASLAVQVYQPGRTALMILPMALKQTRKEGWPSTSTKWDSV